MKVRVLMFTWLAVQSSPGNFVSLFYKAHGLNDSEVAIVLSLSMLASMFMTPVIGAKADKVPSKPGFIAVLQIIRVLVFLALLAAYARVSLIRSFHFEYVLVCAMVFRSLGEAITPVVNAICVAELRKELGPEGHLQFGKERAWGAVSCAIISLSQGVLIDTIHAQMWGLYPLYLLLSFVNLSSLAVIRQNSAQLRSSIFEYEELETVASRLEGEYGSPWSSESGWAEVAFILFKKTEALSLAFFNFIFWIGAGMAIVEQLIFLYFVTELHASNSFCGALVVVTIIFEVPLFSLAPHLLKRCGSTTMLLIGAAAYVVRLIVYGVARNVWVVMLVEPLHGVTYAFVTAASVSYVAERTQDHIQARAQSLLTATTMAGSFVGLGAGGVIIHWFGARALCFSAAVAVGVSGVIFAMFSKFYRQEQL